MKPSRMATFGIAAAALAAAAFGTAGPASADYGNTAIYQIALSDNVSGPQGGGVWLWYELSSDGTGDYQGADCGHGFGAVHDGGSVRWGWADSKHIVIWGTVLNGLEGFPTTVTIPAAFGHYSGTDETFLTLPPFIPGGIGNAQLQVAP
ncbi:hypothetical protein SPF06_03750 [Sinomonas sp. JGH33]|uniref:Secreted protein n=1 Tax=Sinomonas terricola TaxID=3110330 RepID=A0ABU5T2D2_9MICC|nr:hypothetical protein [Sinomonas sp. JGH33]MEA5453828.1 hypothetical protein [Sinomonas sp. JGH33]